MLSCCRKRGSLVGEGMLADVDPTASETENPYVGRRGVQDGRSAAMKKTPGLDPELALSQVAFSLAHEDFSGRFVDMLGAQVTRP